MAETQHSTSAQAKHQVLVLGPLTFITNRPDFSHRFDILDPLDEPSLPRDQFLLTRAGSTQALLCAPHTATVTADLLSLLPSLRLIVTVSAGLNHVDLPECRRRGISVAYAATLFSADVADLAVGLLIDVLRRISAADGFVRNGSWPRRLEYPLGAKLRGRRVGIVGLGNIGLEVAKRLESFGCIISYLSRNKKPLVPYPFYAEISELASEADVLVICCALTDKTRHLINKQVLSALGEKGVIINIARGAVVNEQDLVECLQHGTIAGAGLDVFEKEPDVPKELWALDNVVLSPHAGVITEENFRDLYELMSGNLEAFFSNKPLLSPVPEDRMNE